MATKPALADNQSTTDATPAKTDASLAVECVKRISAGLLAIREEASKDKAGALALKESARLFGSECDGEGRPSVEAWQVFGLLASSVNPTLRLRMECADIARNAATRRLKVLPKYAADDKALGRALDKCAKISGKSATHAGDANITAKFGTPAKVSSVFD